MITPVPKPVAIIITPDHATVALTCESGKMHPPVCVDKSVDPIALGIPDIGKLFKVPMVEKLPLARAHDTPAGVASARTERRK